jgi:hypothetical protein
MTPVAQCVLSKLTGKTTLVYLEKLWKNICTSENQERKEHSEMSRCIHAFRMPEFQAFPSRRRPKVAVQSLGENFHQILREMLLPLQAERVDYAVIGPLLRFEQEPVAVLYRVLGPSPDATW